MNIQRVRYIGFCTSNLVVFVKALVVDVVDTAAVAIDVVGVGIVDSVVVVVVGTGVIALSP